MAIQHDHECVWSYNDEINGRTQTTGHFLSAARRRNSSSFARWNASMSSFTSDVTALLDEPEPEPEPAPELEPAAGEDVDSIVGTATAPAVAAGADAGATGGLLSAIAVVEYSADRCPEIVPPRFSRLLYH